MDEQPSTSSGQPRKSQVTSCAECRRLKLRCDRVFPCASCIRRGCANLCPSGTLEKGKRGFLKRLEQSLPNAKPGSDDTQSGQVAMFVARDTAMTKRIQELEAALTAAGVPIPGNAPPTADSTLHEGETRAKRPRTLSNADPPTMSDAMDVTLGFGTLTIDVDNRSRYVGPSGGAAYLADWWKKAGHSRRGSEDNGVEHAALTDGRSMSPQQMAILAKMRCLPRYEDAVQIAGIYFVNASYMYEVIPRGIFFENVLPAIYPDRTLPYAPTNLHILALLAMVLALGTYFDLVHPPDVVRPIAARYYDLAVTALNITIPLKLDTIPAIQTLNLMALYFLSTQDERGGEPAWQVLGMAMRAIQAQGCHRDGALWKLPPQELEERRRVFWETHMYDRIQSFTFGRPYSQSDAHHDCVMPQTCDTPLPSDDDRELASFSHLQWHNYKFNFARMLGRIADMVFSAQGSTYTVILELNKEINDSYASLPAWMRPEAVKNPIKQLPTHALAGDADLRRNAQVASLAQMYFLTLVHLHRGPFCRALMLGEKGLATSMYKTSIEGLTVAARAIIDNARGFFALHPGLACRMWYFVFHSFTAAVCLAVLVIIAPSHALAPGAYESVEAAIELFDRASGERARLAAERMKLLASRAGQAMENARRSRIENKSVKQQKPAPSDAASVPLRDRDRTAFPTSNLRGTEPEDLLGASTKLIRAQQLPGDEPPASPVVPSAAPHAQHHHPIPVSSGSRFPFESVPAQEAVAYERWHTQPQPPQPTSPVHLQGRRDSMTMEWDATPDAGYTSYERIGVAHTISVHGHGHGHAVQGGHPQTPRSHHHEPNLTLQAHAQGHRPQSYPQHVFPYLSTDADAFDVSGFIQSGAQSWMTYERAPDPDTEDIRQTRAQPHLHSQSTSLWQR
ncbi:Zn(2)-C6 fungal-type domain-containing protein [Mycena kentingensis (nom. inval.)]|nr:Zn(2)-C6 fungal-type domain-containing protein [Mycena kentingensis (nom. inval.)]